MGKYRRRQGVQVSVVIKYRNPRRPGEAGMVLLRDRSQAGEAIEGLERRGFVIVDDPDDDSAFQRGPVLSVRMREF